MALCELVPCALLLTRACVPAPIHLSFQPSAAHFPAPQPLNAPASATPALSDRDLGALGI
eukprot:12718771-Alexandrium_andersonii.AAC.1